ncbi:hypothetical protein LXA43DRAFT_1150161 [Ganoderma leucocontextum]|nr:hypothetical protein LXA43DRAFT_1150161 [Ganoderma leucocontextum]
MSGTCEPHHDASANALTAFMCIGITISYLPQHWRIISAKSSEGFSPWFLLLGSTSSASAMLNIIVMQWGLISCCQVLPFGSCIESIAGVLQLVLVWVLFVLILVLYMVYYPPHLKYVELDVDLPNNLPPQHIKTPVKREAWKLSITLTWAVCVHIAVISFVTYMLLSTNTPDEAHRTRQLQLWTLFLGVTSAVLAAFQYIPQIAHTWGLKLVGALSIPMMCIQTPGAVLMVLSIGLRPGTNWTTWISYAVAGIMQGILLVMCIVFRGRQHALGLDDFGRPLAPPPSYPASQSFRDDVTPAVEDAARISQRVAGEEAVGEDTPLLRTGATKQRRGLFWWLKR